MSTDPNPGTGKIDIFLTFISEILSKFKNNTIDYFKIISTPQSFTGTLDEQEESLKKALDSLAKESFSSSATLASDLSKHFSQQTGSKSNSFAIQDISSEYSMAGVFFGKNSPKIAQLMQQQFPTVFKSSLEDSYKWEENEAPLLAGDLDSISNFMVHLHFLTPNLANRAGRQKQLANLLTKALAKKSNLVAGLCYEAQGEFAEAISYYADAISTKSDPIAMLALSKLLIKLGKNAPKLPEAIADFKPADLEAKAKEILKDSFEAFDIPIGQNVTSPVTKYKGQSLHNKKTDFESPSANKDAITSDTGDWTKGLTPLSIGTKLLNSYKILYTKISKEKLGKPPAAATTVSDGKGNIVTLISGPTSTFALAYNDKGEIIGINKLNVGTTSLEESSELFSSAVYINNLVAIKTKIAKKSNIDPSKINSLQIISVPDNFTGYSPEELFEILPSDDESSNNEELKLKQENSLLSAIQKIQSSTTEALSSLTPHY